MYHRYHIHHAPDGDYVVLMSWTDRTDIDGDWTEHTRWLIPGTQIEEV